MTTWKEGEREGEKTTNKRGDRSAFQTAAGNHPVSRIHGRKTDGWKTGEDRRSCPGVVPGHYSGELISYPRSRLFVINDRGWINYTGSLFRKRIGYDRNDRYG